MKATFVVQHDVLSGLKYLQKTKRKGITVATAQEMIVSLVIVGSGKENIADETGTGFFRPQHAREACV